VSSELATLLLDPAVVTGVLHDGNITRHPESHFLDFVVNARSLRSAAWTPGPDLVTELNRAWLPSVPDAVDRLLGRRPSEDLAPGRVALLVCSVCGDLGCGQLTAALEIGDAEICWSDFRWEDGMSEPRPAEQLPERLTFDRNSYEAAFADAYEQVAAFPYDELAHHGRRFLWPWQWGWKIPRG
jgi:hypothetical protein